MSTPTHSHPIPSDNNHPIQPLKDERGRLSKKNMNFIKKRGGIDNLEMIILCVREREVGGMKRRGERESIELATPDAC